MVDVIIPAPTRKEVLSALVRLDSSSLETIEAVKVG